MSQTHSLLSEHYHRPRIGRANLDVDIGFGIGVSF